jgi:putative tricarboxylic transport membrane protein
MADHDTEVQGPYVSTRWAELVVALLFVLGGLVVTADSLRVGISWGDDGPKAGYFPFYIGCLLAGAGALVAVQALRRWKSLAGDVFVTVDRLKPVLTVLVPTIVYVLLIATIGIYVASAIYITGFMIWQGKFRVMPALVAGLGVPIVIFLLFEVWFLIPLPKGPLEHLLGY